MPVGIASYGAYIPVYRIKLEEIARMWGRNAGDIKKNLGIGEKSVPGLDEDTATISVEAARNAIARWASDPEEIDAIYVGSESHPYAVKPTATIVAEATGASPRLTAADFEFACKAATAAIQSCMGLVQSQMIRHGLAIGADVSQGAPGDALEYTSAAGGAAFIISDRNLMVEIKDTFSFTTDTPDFWRRDGMSYPEHGGRFTGEPAYFKHVMSATKGIMEKCGTSPEDYDYAIFHQPNGKFPVSAARKLGFGMEQIEPGLLIKKIGNTYSASSLLGLTATLDISSPGEKILLTSFGSGAGSDAFSMIVTDEIERNMGVVPSTMDMISSKKYLDYALYSKHQGEIVM